MFRGFFLENEAFLERALLEGGTTTGELLKGRPESITNVDGLYTPQKLDLPDPTTIGKKEPV